MSLLVYGIGKSADGHSVIAATGLQNETLRYVRLGSLAAIVGDHHGPTPQPAVESLWEYEQVVEQIAQEDTILPARFASVLADEDAVRDMLGRRREELLTAVEQIRGAVELALRATWQRRPGARAEPQTGTAYMRRGLELRRRVREVAAELEPLGALSRRCRCDVPAAPAVPLRCAYLVDRAKVGEFTAVVARLDRRLPAVELVCTGPWPPYSFAEGAPA
jgi:gas vesicle protein GvpL/GvpF